MKIKLLSLKTCLFLFVFTLSGNAFATDYFVNNALTADDVYTTAAGNNANSGLTAALPKATLAAAISAASNGDRIFVDYGEYNEVGLNINKSVEIIGLGEELTVFKRTSGVNSWGSISANNVKISKLTITNYNLASDGIALSITSGTGIEFNRVLVYANIGSAGQGAVLVSGAATSVTFRNSGSPCNRILSANYGGGYKIVGSTVVFDNCSINNNVVTSFNGGGLRVEGNTANVTINKCTFDDNSSQAGGAICVVAGTLNINNSCFNGNLAEGNSNIDGGGAIFIQPGAATTVNVNNCSFTNNQANNASADGGAICVKNSSSVSSTINITSCSFTTNTCADRGEDICFDASFSPTFNVTFKNNTFFTVHSGTQVNIHNADFPAASIKFEGLSTPAGTSGNGDIVATPNGVSIDKPEMSGVYTETSSSLPTSLPLTTCVDRFDGACGTVTATIACVTENKWDGSTWSKGTPTVFQHVILNANYNTLTHGNINACQMTVKSGVTLDIVDGTNGTYVYVVNSIFNNGTINVKSKANLVQVNHPLDLNGETIVTPNINFTKNTGNKIRWDYVYWSKPVSDNILSNYNTNFDLKYYWDPDFCINGINFSYEGWRRLLSEPTVGTGFITRVKTNAGLTPTNIALNYSGTSNNGDYTAVVKYYDATHNAFRNFTLLGNPYPGAIKFEDFYKDNSSKIYGTVYLWSANTIYPGSGLYQQADYASFNLTGGVGVPGTSNTQSPNGILPNGYIASGQGFMVRPKVNGTVLFRNTQRTKDLPSNNQFYRENESEKDRYWLRLRDANGKFNELLIGYIKEASYDFDDAYDGPINSLSTIKFYSVLDNNKLIIQGRGEFIDSDKVNVSYTISNPTAVLTISLDKTEGLFTKQKIYLHDKKLGFYHDLTLSDYFFNEDGSQDRFEILYKLNDTDDAINTDEVSVIALLNHGLLSIESNTNFSKIELFDTTGKMIFTNETSINSQSFQKNISIANGVYILNVYCENGIKKSIKIIN
jgi:hypothetical protein